MTTAQFQKMILTWYKRHGRHRLPWRYTRDPYRILVSEIMLQQTQVGRVLLYYPRFLFAFPSVKALAQSSVLDVLRVWQGLGYNRRALFLWRAAKIIERDYGRSVPCDSKTLEKLPGMGPYTARAVRVFVWNRPEVFIETNIRRVFLHFYFKNRKQVSDRDILGLIEKTLWRKNPREWYFALMDYGALALKDIPNPNRKSASYIRQSRFEGSRREVRAKIISHLLHKSAHGRDLQKYNGAHNLDDVLYDLSREGFIKKRGDRWTIAS